MWKTLFEYSCAVGGPVHIDVAAAVSGLPASRIRARGRREGWWQPYRDVIAPPGTPQTGQTWALAALARVKGPDPDEPSPAALTRWSAAAHYGVKNPFPTRVQVAVPYARAPRGDKRLEVVRCRKFDLRTVRERENALVVAPVWLLRSLAPRTTVSALTDLVIDLVQQRHTTLEEVAAHHEELAPYPGCRTMAQVLARLTAAGRVDSPPELECRERLLAAGVPLDEGQIEVACTDGGAIHLDMGIKRIFFGLDMQSMRAHATRAQLLVDVKRTNQLVRLPETWRVVHATVEDLGRNWERFVALVKDVVAEQSRRHLGLPWPTP
jgi:hypothetical protein